MALRTKEIGINARSIADGNWIARDAFVKNAPAGWRIVRINLARVEPLRPFESVGASQTDATACYVFAVTFERPVA